MILQNGLQFPSRNFPMKKENVDPAVVLHELEVWKRHDNDDICLRTKGRRQAADRIIISPERFNKRQNSTL